jgi:predicted ArsR family transcriptional regulator
MLDKGDAGATLGKKIGAAWAADLHESLSGSDHDQRVAAAIRALDETGCEVEWLSGEGRLQITFHNCPYSNIVDQYPEICDMEQTFLEEVIGLPVQVIESGPGCEQCVFVMTNEPVSIQMAPAR